MNIKEGCLYTICPLGDSFDNILVLNIDSVNTCPPKFSIFPYSFLEFDNKYRDGYENEQFNLGDIVQLETEELQEYGDNDYSIYAFLCISNLLLQGCSPREVRKIISNSAEVIKKECIQTSIFVEKIKLRGCLND